MSSQEIITYAPHRVRRPRRLLVRAVVSVARLLARQPPARIRRLLTLIARGAAPADHAGALAAREAVAAASLACSGPQGCLPRSIAAALLCRMGGTWPVWCVGVRTIAPFGAHAWVEAEGRAVNEPHPAGYYQLLFAVPPGGAPVSDGHA